MLLPVIAAVALGLLAVAWVAYPAAMWLAARRRPAPGPAPGSPGGRVVVVVATRDDPAFAASRVRNLRAAHYPAHLLRVVVAVDAASVFPIVAYREALAGLADAVPGDPPGGKACALNAGVRAAGACEVLAFADVGQEFEPDAIPRLVRALDTGLHGVTGRYTHGRGDTVMSTWADLEATIRAGQAARGSIVSATGAIFAMRPASWADLPAGLICDDLFTGLSIVRQGGRVGFCPEAVAFDPRPLTRDQQFARRARTLTGLIQYCLVVPGVLLPWRNPVWLHFVLHKILRLLTPVLLGIGALALATWALSRLRAAVLLGIGAALLAGAIAFLAAPVWFRRRRDDLLWVLRLQLVPLVAIGNGLRGRWTVWTPTPQGNPGLPGRP